MSGRGKSNMEWSEGEREDRRKPIPSCGAFRELRRRPGAPGRRRGVRRGGNPSAEEALRPGGTWRRRWPREAPPDGAGARAGARDRAAAGVPIFEAARACSTPSRRPVAAAGPAGREEALSTLEQALDGRGGPALIAVCTASRTCGNLGTVLRTADAASRDGADPSPAPRPTASPPGRSRDRGSIFRLPPPSAAATSCSRSSPRDRSAPWAPTRARAGNSRRCG